MKRDTNLIKLALLSTLLATLKATKFTMRVPGGETRCLGDFIPKNQVMDFSFFVEAANKEDENKLDTLVQIFNGSTILKTYRNKKMESIQFSLNRTTPMRFCALNYGSVEIAVSAELCSGSEINDFSMVPSDVKKS